MPLDRRQPHRREFKRDPVAEAAEPAAEVERLRKRAEEAEYKATFPEETVTLGPVETDAGIVEHFDYDPDDAPVRTEPLAPPPRPEPFYMPAPKPREPLRPPSLMGARVGGGLPGFPKRPGSVQAANRAEPAPTPINPDDISRIDGDPAVKQQTDDVRILVALKRGYLVRSIRTSSYGWGDWTDTRITS